MPELQVASLVAQCEAPSLRAWRMTNTLLEELLDSDIDWMVQQGQRHTFSASQVLISQGQSLDRLYILLSGSLAVAIADSLAVNPGLGQTLLDLSPGEIVGEVGLLRSPLSAVMVHAQADSVVLELPYAALQPRLKQDPAFASRFYRAIAILLLRRFEQVLENFLDVGVYRFR